MTPMQEMIDWLTGQRDIAESCNHFAEAQRLHGHIGLAERLLKKEKEIMDAAREDEAGKWEAERERMVRDAAFGKELAVEFGYKQCEKGNNLEAAMLNYKKLIV